MSAQEGTSSRPPETRVIVAPNGAAMAAFVAAGVGALAMGLLVLLNEAGVFVAPTLYGPAGGVSGRTTLAVAIWLVAWGVLHALCKDRHLDGGRVLAVTLVLVALALVATFPPLWGVFGG